MPSKTDVAGILLIIIVCMIVIGFGLKSWNAGKNAQEYKPICIEGHVYHTVNFGNKMGITIKLDDEGRPVKCQN